MASYVISHLSSSSSLESPHRSQLRTCVAAVCYRFRGNELEFLLVRTKSGRWTFPKGGVEIHETLADAAAREAYEEAGVYGSIESFCFTQYRHAKSMLSRGVDEQIVRAYLLEVESTVSTLETFRRPSWFSLSEAKRRLAKSRTEKYATELANVIGHAVTRLATQYSQ